MTEIGFLHVLDKLDRYGIAMECVSVVLKLQNSTCLLGMHHIKISLFFSIYIFLSLYFICIIIFIY